jgi:hypothetical protein
VISLVELERDAVIAVCAVSAGIHGALVPDHFAEGTGPGAGFLASAVVLAALAIRLTRRPASTTALAALVLAGLLASYALATTTGLPVLHPDPEPVGGLALFTKTVEVVGLLAAAHLLRSDRSAVATTPLSKGRLT